MSHRSCFKAAYSDVSDACLYVIPNDGKCDPFATETFTKPAASLKRECRKPTFSKIPCRIETTYVRNYYPILGFFGKK